MPSSDRCREFGIGVISVVGGASSPTNGFGGAESAPEKTDSGVKCAGFASVDRAVLAALGYVDSPFAQVAGDAGPLASTPPTYTQDNIPNEGGRRRGRAPSARIGLFA